MGASVVALEQLLAGNGLREKPAGLALLSGPGAQLHVASALPSRSTAAAPLPIGLAPFDRLLSGGLPRGRLTELVGRRSNGRFSIVLAALASATSCGEAAALVDRGNHLDPQSAREAGVDLGRLLWARPRRVAVLDCRRRDGVSSRALRGISSFSEISLRPRVTHALLPAARRLRRRAALSAGRTAAQRAGARGRGRRGLRRQRQRRPRHG